jgi:hypothetical protein
MRDMSAPLFKEVLARGNETVSITPGSVAQLATFEISGMPPVTAGMKNYLDVAHASVELTFDPDAAGNAVDADKLYKGVASHRLSSQWLGQQYPHQQTRGAVSALVINPIANGGIMTQHARIQIPASTDTDVTVTLYMPAPLAHECLKKPHELSQWIGFYDGGTLEVAIADTAVYDGDYAGAVIKAPITVRAFLEYHPSPDEALGVPFQWRERQIVGGGNQPLLKGVGQETDLLGVEQGCGLAFLGWLTDATGMGLSGPDGVDNIVSVEIPWRGQTQLRNIDGYWLAFRRAMGKRVGPISGLGTTIMHDGAGYPTTMAATPNGRYSANAQQLFLPLVFPGLDFETSKAQRLGGDLPINFSFTAAVTNTHRFVSWELMEFDNNQIARLAEAMGHKGETPFRKGLGGAADAGDLRYTRWHFR